MGFDGDANPHDAAVLARESFKLLKTACRPGAYAACFWTMRSLDLLLDAVRPAGWSYLRVLTMHCAGTARPHLSWVPRIQPIVLFRNGSRASDLHDRFSVWLKAAINEKGISTSQLASALDVDTRLIMKWSRYRDPAWCLPTERHYSQLKSLVGLTDEYDTEILSRTRPELKEPRAYQQDLYKVDTGKKVSEHPAEKPLAVVQHVCGALADIGETVIDPFMGSGTTGVGCLRSGRRFIGIESDPNYFDICCARMDAERKPQKATGDLSAAAV